MVQHKVLDVGINRPCADGGGECRPDAPVYMVVCFGEDCRLPLPLGEDAAPGDCLICRQNGWGPGEAVLYDWVQIQSNVLEDYLRETGLPLNQVLHIEQPDCLRKYLTNIAWELNERPLLHDVKASILVESMLVYMVRSYHMKKTAAEQKYGRAMNELRASLRRDLHKHWTLQTMADYVDLSISRFSDIYRQLFWRSPVEDLITMRVEKARTLLMDTNMPIRGVALDCGFRDEVYFSKTFRRKIGLTPGKFRIDARR